MIKAAKIVVAAALAAVACGPVMANHVCAYANDNIYTGGSGQINTVDGYKFGVGGLTSYLQPVATNGEGTGSGFSTGGLGALRISHNDLYVDDATTNDITHFKISPASCALTRDNNIYSSGDTGLGMGDSLAVTPNGSFLYVGSTGDNNIYLLSILPRSGLSAPTLVATTADVPASIAVSPDGKMLVASYTNNQQLCAYPINASDGTLGTPNCRSTTGFPAGISIDPASGCVYAGEVNPGASEVAAIPLASGELGSPVDYILGPGLNSSAVLVSGNGYNLYISNQDSAQVTTATVTSGCQLAYNGNIVSDGNGTDTPGQLAQGGKLPYIVTGDYSSVMTPRMGIFEIRRSMLRHYQGRHGLTTMPNNAPFSVVAIVEK
jgi:hypothetical protein